MYSLTQLKHVIFDLDGVLIDSSPCHAAAYLKLWDKLTITGPDYNTIAGQRTTEVVSEQTKHLSLDASQIAKWVNYKQLEARRLISQRLLVFSDSFAVINKLYNRHIKISVVTGASRKSAMAALLQIGVSSLIDTVVTAEDVSRGKPNPEGFLQAVAKSDSLPVNTLIIEDSNIGIDAALATGAFVCSVRSGIKRESKQFIGTFDDLESIEEFIRTIE